MKEPPKFLSALIVLSFIQPVAAASTSSATVQSALPATQSSSPLQGRVRSLHLLEQDILGHIGSTVESMKKSCLVVMNELAMPHAVTGTGPDIIGDTVVPSFPSPSGVMYLGHEDPHPAAVAAAINTLIDQAKHLEEEISTTQAASDAPEYAKELWDKLREISEKLYADLNDLTSLARSKGAQYATVKMEKLALRIYDKSEAINKLRRRIAGELHKSK